MSRFHQSCKSLILASQHCTTVQQIRATHALFIINGLHRNTYAISKLLTALLPLPHLNKHFHYASTIFDCIEFRNSFVYDAMIRICSRSYLPHLGVRYFRLMMTEDIAPSYLTFHFLLVSSLNACLYSLGKQIHCRVMKNGVLSSDGHVQTGVIRLYVEDDVLSDAHKLFDEIPDPDVVKWDVLMNGYVRCGLGSDCLKLFTEMLARGTEPDQFSVRTALTACAQAGALTQGKWIHELLEKNKRWIESDVFVGTALVDMYAKCGSIEMAKEVFQKLARRNVFSWAALIGGFAAYGYATEAIMCLEQMEREYAIKPDSVVLLGVLAACAHGGFLREGRSMFDSMEARYGITPKHEHYSCIVDLMCRAGRLDDALDLIHRMPMKPRASVWGAFLNGCRTHKSVELGELAVRNLLELEKGDAGEEEAALVQLSNIYLTVRRNAEASKIRQMLGQKGIRKAPGCSVLEVDGNVTKFVSGDVSHPNLLQIHTVIHLLSADVFQFMSH